jgi:G-patch domain
MCPDPMHYWSRPSSRADSTPKPLLRATAGIRTGQAGWHVSAGLLSCCCRDIWCVESLLQAHERGVGSKIMAAMGFVAGRGLGKAGAGIAAPIQVQASSAPQVDALVKLSMLRNQTRRTLHSMRWLRAAAQMSTVCRGATHNSAAQ